METYKQVTVEQADALQLSGVDVFYRFPLWDVEAKHSPMSGIRANSEWTSVPSKFYAVYNTSYWASTGVPSFYVEVE